MGDFPGLSEFHVATILLLKTFKKYAEGGESLTKAQFKNLVDTEMPLPEEEKGNAKQRVDEMMEGLDQNKNNKIDFNEFMVLVASLTMILCKLCEGEME